MKTALQRYESEKQKGVRPLKLVGEGAQAFVGSLIATRSHQEKFCKSCNPVKRLRQDSQDYKIENFLLNSFKRSCAHLAAALVASE
jgi:hypothetical protein